MRQFSDRSPGIPAGQILPQCGIALFYGLTPVWYLAIFPLTLTYNGLLFTFDPVAEKIESKGYNWPGEQRYTCSMDRSPGGRYVYYLPGAHGHGYSDGSPEPLFPVLVSSGTWQLSWKKRFLNGSYLIK